MNVITVNIFAIVILFIILLTILTQAKSSYWKSKAREFDDLREWAGSHDVFINWHSSQESPDRRTYVLRRKWVPNDTLMMINVDRCKGIKFAELYARFRRIRELQYDGLSDVGVRDMLSTIAHDSQLERKQPVNFWKGY
ncbi:hypothetical protein JNMOADIG_00041 [Aeromonas phage avDM5]|uniref:Uncharacterized protein n=1 Tax=Aeromonas phage vB_AehM_DM2 TaxID=2973716 RepID=A0AA94YNN5_9CAUD|nr:hypothetical protein JNMOADIG_00041 [Aeromonas phage avDM5]UYD60456.1 hypothetical protein NPHMPGLK_00121 [Aeromonas phage avDM2]UYD60708.1 hypothetical protein NHNEHLNL_00112 [Aeromonas phage avDM2]